MNRTRKLVASAAAALAFAGLGVVTAPPASAGGMVTIYPNFADSNCGLGSKVGNLQVASFPGTSSNWQTKNQRWAAIRAPQGASVRIVANLYCITRNVGTYKTVTKNISRVEANKSYYF